MSYQPKNFEEKWVEIWEKEKVYQTPKITDEKKKRYILSMFPYPSGAGLHVGHVRIYTGTDVLARYFRMKGDFVLHPMGFDAFGLPAENAAIKAKKNPLDMVPKNIANFKRQMKMLGFSYDWQREFSTTDPEYYKWTQWLFIQFFKMGLLEKRKIPVYYCPSCKTGLAEEEVLPDGTHERCGKPITRKTLPQWVFKITKYADKLLQDLDGLDWPDGILEMQRNWIGKSEGVEIEFEIFKEKRSIKVFTTRVDTLFGVTALVVAPEHQVIEDILKGKIKIKEEIFKKIKKYVEEAKRKLDLARTDLTKEKSGVFTGLFAIHPLTQEKIPVWVADYVLGWYGEGAVMVVPAHDERDFEFAKKFSLEIRQVIAQDDAKLKKEKLDKAFTNYGVLINSKEFSGLTSSKAMIKITQKLEKMGKGRKKVTYKLRDWIFSRQRYWGEPIPMVYCQSCAKRKFKVAVFLDDANLFYGAKKAGWRIDLERLKTYLNKELGEVVFMKYFISLPDKKDSSFKKTMDYLKKIEKKVEIVAKPLKYINFNGKILKKGNVDVELTVHSLESINQYDVAVILSGDSDFVGLRDNLWRKGKKVIFIAYKKNLSYELKQGKYLFLERIRDEVESSVKKNTPIKNRGLLQKLLYGREDDLSREENGWLPLNEEDLPLKLPYLKYYEPTETGESPLSKVKDWVNTTCPKCGGEAKRETDTMPNWAGSCWYFLAFAFWDKDNQGKNFLVKKNSSSSYNLNQEVSQWLPVDWYLGGAEHAVLHLLYSRFWVKALYDAHILPFKEPFLRLRNVGMVLAEDHRKMSKSFGNTVNPDDVVLEYGADTLRLYEMFMAPFSNEIAWSNKALQGCYRFLKRINDLYESWYEKHGKLDEDKSLVIKLNKTIKKVEKDIEKVKFNTAIAAMMEFLNEWEASYNLKQKTLNIENAKKFLKILAVFAPFITEEIWRQVFNEKTSIHLASWPKTQEDFQDEEVVIPVQINGKKRATIKVNHQLIKDKEKMERQALENEKVRKYLEGKKYKVVYVEGKIINFIV